jgi:hypothetical protein
VAIEYPGHAAPDLLRVRIGAITRHSTYVTTILVFAADPELGDLTTAYLDERLAGESFDRCSDAGS